MIIARHGSQQLEHVIRDIKKFTSFKIIEAIRNNPQESRRELLLWLFERAGKRNPNNTHYQFWQQREWFEVRGLWFEVLLEHNL